MTNMDTLKEFAAALRTKKETTKPFDTTAEVVRTEGSTAWVHIPGGVDETPVQMGVSVKPGDVVNVRVSGGRAWIIGNSTRPPTDDARAIKADNRAIAAETTATEAVEVAEAAAKSAAATRQYFWHDSEGAHVATVEDDATTGPNTLIDSTGMKIRNGTSVLAAFLANLISLGEVSITGSGITFGDPDDPYAEFERNQISLGSDMASIDFIDHLFKITAQDVTPYALVTLGRGYDSTAMPLSIWITTATNPNQSSGRASVTLSHAVTGTTSRIDLDAESIYVNNTAALDNTGRAYKAISDGNGNNIVDTYMPKTNGAVTDLDDATSNGIYTYANTASNIPTSTGGCLLVMVHSANYIHQMALPNNANGTSRLFTRMKTASGWGAWTEH